MWKGGLTPERQALYASPEWVDAVKMVWARDNATCQKCGAHHNTAKSRGTFHIHHIVSFMVRELRADVDNLVLLCRDCHHWVHSKSNESKLFIKESK
jgi:thymidylate synthase (FAD)